jgi:hypothetical protein
MISIRSAFRSTCIIFERHQLQRRMGNHHKHLSSHGWEYEQRPATRDKLSVQRVGGRSGEPEKGNNRQRAFHRNREINGASERGAVALFSFSLREMVMIYACRVYVLGFVFSFLFFFFLFWTQRHNLLLILPVLVTAAIPR